MERYLYNNKIISCLSKIISTYPELRFCQILTGLGLDVDRFYEEPDKTLKTIEESALYKDVLEKCQKN